MLPVNIDPDTSHVLVVAAGGTLVGIADQASGGDAHPRDGLESHGVLDDRVRNGCRRRYGRESIELRSIELHSLELHSSSEHQCSSSEHLNSSIKHHCSSNEHHSSSSDHHNSSSEHHNSSSEHHGSSSEQKSSVSKCNIVFLVNKRVILVDTILYF